MLVPDHNFVPSTNLPWKIKSYIPDGRNSAFSTKPQKVFLKSICIYHTSCIPGGGVSAYLDLTYLIGWQGWLFQPDCLTQVCHFEKIALLKGVILSILPYSRVYFRKNVDNAINGFGLIWTKNHTYLAILCVFRKFVKNEAFFGRSALLKGLILTTKLPYSRVWFYAASSAQVCTLRSECPPWDNPTLIRSVRSLLYNHGFADVVCTGEGGYWCRF